MPEISKKYHEAGEEALAREILLQASKDYVQAVLGFSVGGKQPAWAIQELEFFFRTQCYLPAVDAENLIKVLRKKAWQDTMEQFREIASDETKLRITVSVKYKNATKNTRVEVPPELTDEFKATFAKIAKDLERGKHPETERSPQALEDMRIEKKMRQKRK